MRTCLSAAILMFVIPLFGNEGQWELVYPEEYPVPEGMTTGNFSDKTIATWGKIVFITEEDDAAILDEDGARTIRLPYNGDPYDHFQARQLIQRNGRFFFFAEFSTPKQWTDSAIFSTTDFLEYSDELYWTGWEYYGSDIVQTWPVAFKKSGDQLFVVEGIVRGNSPPRWRIFDGETWQLYTHSRLSHSISDRVFFPALDQFVILTDSNEVVILKSLDKSGLVSPFVTFEVESWPGYFRRLTCLDANTIVAYGDSAELALIRADGSIHLSHPWKFFPPDDYRIEFIRFVNGWYYLVGSVTLRTRDFETYEKVETPHAKELVAVRHYKDRLLGFLKDAIFEMSLEHGYLDSIEPQPNWHHADWLGWFQIIDEEKGDIDHLLLGKCWVKQVSEQEYWLRTSTLGWIYIYKDWSPWFWRMDDGHWYWLDQNGWPPRAWDADAEEWLELRP